MTTSAATKSTFAYWVFLALALSFLFAGLGASAIGFEFSQREWLNTGTYAALISLNALNVVLVIPQLLALALYGRNTEALKNLFS